MTSRDSNPRHGPDSERTCHESGENGPDAGTKSGAGRYGGGKWRHATERPDVPTGEARRFIVCVMNPGNGKVEVREGWWLHDFSLACIECMDGGECSMGHGDEADDDGEVVFTGWSRLVPEGWEGADRWDSIGGVVTAWMPFPDPPGPTPTDPEGGARHG